ncbi:UNVERIFIED_CONTAM: hypothetical protein PYX00_007612 [Menopon gallinae]|uniref:ZAD domain-containing protein n=1 Tax=Menopon gallinae TaxID=328185 RepID=A0AAW2HJZ5_9NEOP
MGSTARGLITGFICRLCSKMNRYVILIYGEDGERMGLADKINSYLPISVNRQDPLPKTVCLDCVARLENHCRMLQMISNAENRFKSEKENLARRTHRENEDEDESEVEYHTGDQGGTTNEDDANHNQETENPQV